MPPLDARVIDRSGSLSAPQREALSAKLEALERETGAQLVILLVPGTQPEDLAAYAQRVGDQWKLGRAGVGDGVLLLVAKDERKVRIAVAKALEGAIPDLAARRVIDQQIVPSFRAGDIAGGLNRAVDALGERIRGEGLPAQAPTLRGGPGSEGLDLAELAIFFLAGVPVLGALATAVFGSGGGGDFGGGGASGDW
ncbi:TPM domain-containing protein [Piscinibacter sakaiensis]|uniref:TPM domain-containing protein n=1 Tax=Piscinibacter sakaiensis TaxID=1547922 RepID=UPI00372B9417